MPRVTVNKDSLAVTPLPSLTPVAAPESAQPNHHPRRERRLACTRWLRHAA